MSPASSTDPGSGLPPDGSYLVSRFEERWDNWQSSETRELAIAYGVTVMEWDNADEGEIFYTARIEPFGVDDLVGHALVDADAALDGIDEFLIEMSGDNADCVDDPFPTTGDQRADLNQRLREAVRSWIVGNALSPACRRLVAVQRHVFRKNLSGETECLP